jgi:hypothetical protein
VTEDGSVSFQESERRHWSGTIGADLSASLEKTFRVTCSGEPRTDTVSYSGQIKQEDGVFSLEVEATETWCPPNCVFRTVYSIVLR